MVWALFPADPLSGEDRYYIFKKGTYKVGRKGCDVIINKGKGVSRVHAEIVVDAVTSPPGKSDQPSSRVRIRDCSKYGTFITNNLGSKEKIHEFPNKETTLKDGDLVSFGTGSATYRFSVVPLVFFVCCSESSSVNFSFQDKISSIGAQITNHLSEQCTHVLVDQLMPMNDKLIDAILSEKPVILKNWVDVVAEKGIGLDFPSWSSYVPTFTVEGMSIKVADAIDRGNTLRGYTCLLEASHKYKFGNRLQSLLEEGGSKVTLIEDFCSNSQGSDYGQNNRVVCVIPGRSADNCDNFSRLSTLSRVNEVDLVCAVLSGRLDSSVLISPSVAVSSSCSTDETVVADSDAEAETATSFHVTTNISKEEAFQCVDKTDVSLICPADRLENTNIASFKDSECGMTAKREKVDEFESGSSDIIYSQNLIVRHVNLPAVVNVPVYSGAVNFKRFRKRNIRSGNSFNSLIPFSKYPYKDSDCSNQEMMDSIREEKKRKQMEAIAEDLFNNEKGKRRGTVGFLRGILT